MFRPGLFRTLVLPAPLQNLLTPSRVIYSVIEGQDFCKKTTFTFTILKKIYPDRDQESGYFSVSLNGTSWLITREEP